MTVDSLACRLAVDGVTTSIAELCRDVTHALYRSSSSIVDVSADHCMAIMTTYEVASPVDVRRILVAEGLASSRADAKRQFRDGACRLNTAVGPPITDPNIILAPGEAVVLTHGHHAVVVLAEGSDFVPPHHPKRLDGES